MFMIFVVLITFLNFVRHSFEYAFLFFLISRRINSFLVHEETGPYQVLAGTVPPPERFVFLSSPRPGGCYGCARL